MEVSRAGNTKFEICRALLTKVSLPASESKTVRETETVTGDAGVQREFTE